ncbi:MAG TPA: hypothetical protein VJ436_00695, partial [Anaerolineales bacterium]|nr:hypothetical protein [Anaerolineales bacterium]
AAGPAPGQPAEDFPSAVQAAIRSLTRLLSVQPSQVEVVSAERTMWRDSCLGLATAGEMCLQVITPGYRVILQVGEKKYEIHTDESGENLRHAPGELVQTPKTDLAQAQVIIAAVRALGEAQDLGTEQIEVRSIEAVEWPDACLGFPAPEQVCAAVITPGYRIILRSGGQEYEVHTDATGESVRLQPAAP